MGNFALQTSPCSFLKLRISPWEISFPLLLCSLIPGAFILFPTGPGSIPIPAFFFPSLSSKRSWRWRGASAPVAQAHGAAQLAAAAQAARRGPRAAAAGALGRGCGCTRSGAARAERRAARAGPDGSERVRAGEWRRAGTQEADAARPRSRRARAQQAGGMRHSVGGGAQLARAGA
jgi:hypothetical protein